MPPVLIICLAAGKDRPVPVSAWTGNSKRKDPLRMDEKGKPPNSNQATMLRRRGLDPKDFVVVKDTYVSLYVRDLRNGRIKIINKNN